tara:strand:- start:145 stop:342 length:198 start_codon:yes stop_codon:yes gene_type:complete
MGSGSRITEYNLALLGYANLIKDSESFQEEFKGRERELEAGLPSSDPYSVGGEWYNKCGGTYENK